MGHYFLDILYSVRLEFNLYQNILGASDITANLYCIGKVAWFEVYVCGNIWNALYIKEGKKGSRVHVWRHLKIYSMSSQTVWLCAPEAVLRIRIIFI